MSSTKKEKGEEREGEKIKDQEESNKLDIEEIDQLETDHIWRCIWVKKLSDVKENEEKTKVTNIY